MLNLDGLVGSAGELLSHNMYTYTKNNPVNMSDPSGFRPILSASLAEETEEMKKVSLETMRTTQITRSIQCSSAHMIVDNITDAIGSTIGTAASVIADIGITQGIAKVASKISRPIDYLFSTPKIGYVQGFAGKVGVLNSIALGLNTADNFLHYDTKSAIGRTVVDAMVFGGTVAFAVWTAPFWAPTVTGLVVGTAINIGVGFIASGFSGFGKDALFGNRKYH